MSKTVNHLTLNKERKRIQKVFNKPSCTDRSFKSDCDLSVILRKHQQTGLISHVNRNHGDYLDLTSYPQDYMTSLNQVMAAQDNFMSLPSSIRARFSNDPAQFLEFVSNPDNHSEMVDLGLTKNVDVGNVTNEEIVPEGDVTP